MNPSFQDVSLEDIQQQLQLLGHSVPNHLVSAYLREVNATQHTSELPAIPSNGHARAGEARSVANLKSATSQSAPTCNARANGGSSQDQLQQDVEFVDRSCAPPAGTWLQSHPEIQPEMRSSPCQEQPLNDSSRPARTSVTPAPEAAEATAKPAGVTSFSNGENVFHHRSFQSEEATESPSHAPDQGSLHPDHLLPEDVLQRARSIINEHLAEHRMPLVDSLSDFTLQDVPSSQPGASRYPVGKTSGPAHRRTSARTRDADSTDAEPFTQDAHKIPHTATIPTSARQANPHAAAERPSTAPSQHRRNAWPVAGHSGRENSTGGQEQVSAHVARLRTGASGRRSALESLDASVFNSELPHDDSVAQSCGKARETVRPSTAGAGQRSTHSRPQTMRVNAHAYLHGYSSHGLEEDGDEEAQHRRARRTPRALSPEQPRLRPQVNMNSSILTGRSRLNGQARKIDRVARYQQLSKQWSKDPFLSGTSRRKNQGFQEAYAAAHELSQAQLAATKAVNASDRPRTSSLRSYIPPGEKRRDRLRWDMRTQMQMQDNV